MLSSGAREEKHFLQDKTLYEYCPLYSDFATLDGNLIGLYIDPIVTVLWSLVQIKKPMHIVGNGWTIHVLAPMYPFLKTSP